MHHGKQARQGQKRLAGPEIDVRMITTGGGKRDDHFVQIVLRTVMED